MPWNECEDGEDPLEEVTIPAGTYPMYNSFFMQASLKKNYGLTSANYPLIPLEYF